MSLYDFYMYLKHIEHSPENLEFYVWYVSLPVEYESILLMSSRFKNFEAGRLTSLSEVPREKTGFQEHSSEFGSETDLSKADNYEKSFGGTTVADVNGDFGLEEHGKFIDASDRSHTNNPQLTQTRSTSKSLPL
jgi:hypothetical protein